MALGRKLSTQVNDIFGDFDDYDGFGDSMARPRRRKRRKTSRRAPRSSRKRSRKRVKRSRSRLSRQARKSPTKGGIRFTKNGQPYVIDKKTGKARFIKRRR